MSEPMTEAEQAAYAVIRPEATCALYASEAEDLARKVLAAARPIIAAEALREESAYLLEHRRDNDGAFDLWQMYEAGGPEWLASRAALRTTTPEKES